MAPKCKCGNGSEESEHRTKMWRFSLVLNGKTAGSKIQLVVFNGGIRHAFKVLEIDKLKLRYRIFKDYIFWNFIW